MKTRVFRSGNSRAVRIPASIHLAVQEMEIIDLGEEGILLKPVSSPEERWNLFREGIAELEGSWPERKQEVDQNRSEW